jgi:hypothetical protein
MRKTAFENRLRFQKLGPRSPASRQQSSSPDDRQDAIEPWKSFARYSDVRLTRKPSPSEEELRATSLEIKGS